MPSISIIWWEIKRCCCELLCGIYPIPKGAFEENCVRKVIKHFSKFREIQSMSPSAPSVDVRGLFAMHRNIGAWASRQSAQDSNPSGAWLLLLVYLGNLPALEANRLNHIKSRIPFWKKWSPYVHNLASFTQGCDDPTDLGIRLQHAPPTQRKLWNPSAMPATYAESRLWAWSTTM